MCLNKEIYYDVNRKNESLIESELNKRGILARNASVTQLFEGKLRINVWLINKSDKCFTVADAGNIISRVLSKRIDVSENNRVIINGNWNEYVFYETGRFETVWGVAQRSYTDGAVSGDNYLVHKLPEGKMIFGIADGMGVGLNANINSQMTLERLDNAISMGFSEQNAIEMTNMVLSARRQYQTTVAIDLCRVDLYSGLAEFIKLGAVAAYIKRGNEIESIQSETLPIGLLDEVDFDSVSKKLYGGDYIIMVSDGIIEMMSGYNKEREFARIINGLQSLNPTAMANELINTVINKRTICDDLTAMVIGIYE